jgi:chorismate dehydratase
MGKELGNRMNLPTPPAVQPLRIGKISYLNTLPMVFNLPLEQQLGIPVQWFEAPPTRLNNAMLNKELDISLVSAAAFLQHQTEWVLLPHISISSFAPVRSVLWVADTHGKPLSFAEALSQFETFPVTADSASSVLLLRCLAQLYTGKPLPTQQLKPYPAEKYRDYLGHYGNALMIGDAALSFMEAGLRKSDCVFDLSQLWTDYHGGTLPFVFGVWVAQRTWAEANPAVLQRLVGALQYQVQQNLQNPVQKQALLQHAYRLGYTATQQLDSYFSHSLSYQLTPQHQQAMQQFYHYLTEFNLL